MARNKTEQFRLNKSAFDEVLGDPYGLEEVVGQYVTLNTRSTIRIANELGLGHGTTNPAKPSPIDFICDVEKAVRLGLTQYSRGDEDQFPTLLKTFIATYITEEATGIFDANERRDIEQIIGRILMDRGIAPVRRYFLTIRKKVNYDVPNRLCSTDQEASQERTTGRKSRTR
jgi:hypothetical protein